MAKSGMEVNQRLVREIKKYNITSVTRVRGSGSTFDGHKCRCLWDICGKPMLQWALEVPLASKYVNKVVLHSEDQEILDVGRKIKGVTVIPRPLSEVLTIPRDWNVGVFQRQRPRSLFSGETFSGPAYEQSTGPQYAHGRMYCFWYLQEYESFVTDIAVIVPANEPLSTAETLDKLIEAFFLDEEANVAVTLYPIAPSIWTINPITKRPFPLLHEWGLDRQYYLPLYRYGPFMIFGNASKATYMVLFKQAYIIIPPEEGADVHNEEDLALANFYMKRRLSRKKGGE